ncbi:J domain-containing protein [Phyllobacterium endophyticum]|jgi:curved DNA-binding protein CbpA|uniref:Molecular chaperone DnaJ n=1 Tax=Phyllobacterium endophyticum TaxID=1149773 RepID=A0A2P7ALH5_9HYPH|nr:J domain-containing protein [Phyllobacterium endophyticum]MBB3236411.1 curved DNA-binding protein CbpA [Phyllobacterium endophyticum]PSH55062.1 molecular chaperone DnaJ [Phyllobacterium endophyticum]TXR49405.1 J domain-containing protein [Phyllobacterium endophyticum]TYR39943.1 J domain-containing protein [Phyllobacterium endophyticum]
MTSSSKYFDSIRIRPKKADEEKSRTPVCQWDGCDKPGPHRAPVGREKEGEFFHFCIDHVREYNKGYNYFSGLSDAEVARYQKEALTGDRPTWTVAGLPGSGAGASASTRAQASASAKTSPDFSKLRSGRAAYQNRFRDPNSVFNEARVHVRKLKPLESKALDTLGLGAKATGEDIKSRYKELVKIHHPDANGGDRASEDRFRDVIQAYQLLKAAGFC